MTTLKKHHFSFEELCEVAELSSHVIIEIVEHGIVEPDGENPQNWVFNTQMITVTKKACRLNRDLGIEWAGIALAMKLLDEVEQLRIENQQLHSRLNRFIADSEDNT